MPSQSVQNVKKLSKPLLVVQGKNDPRVPASESEQMVKASERTAAKSGTSWPMTKATASTKSATSITSLWRPSSSTASSCSIEQVYQFPSGFAADRVGLAGTANASTESG